ncbi:hypothetical protein CF326_g1804 [Tilletia indica]|nr:hypothetical protein CF326_g1804 [Tilletia indica]
MSHPSSEHTILFNTDSSRLPISSFPSTSFDQLDPIANEKRNSDSFRTTSQTIDKPSNSYGGDTTSSSQSHSPVSFHSAHSTESTEEADVDRSRSRAESSGSFQSVSNISYLSATSSSFTPAASRSPSVNSSVVPRISVRVQRQTSDTSTCLSPASAQVKRQGSRSKSQVKTEEGFKDSEMAAMDENCIDSTESRQSPSSNNDTSSGISSSPLETKKRDTSKSPPGSTPSTRSPQRSYDSPAEHQRASAASAIVKAAAKAAAASVQSLDSSACRKEGPGMGKREMLDCPSTDVWTMSPPSASNEHTQPSEDVTKSSPGAKNGEAAGGGGGGQQKPSLSNAAQQSYGEHQDGNFGIFGSSGMKLGTSMIPPHLLWRQATATSGGSLEGENAGMNSQESAWMSMAGLNERSPVHSQEQSGRSGSSAQLGGGGIGSGAGIGSPPSHGVHGAEFRTGDWVCVSDTCSFHNFAQNLTCLGCGTAKPVGTCGDNPPQRTQQQGTRDHGKHAAGSPQSNPTTSASGLGSSNSAPLTAAQIQELMAQHRAKTEGGTTQQQQQQQKQQNVPSSSAASSTPGVAASQWAPGGTFASSLDHSTTMSQQGGRGGTSYFTSQAGSGATGGSSYFTSQAGSGTTGGGGMRYGATNNYSSFNSFSGGTSTPPPAQGISQANMAALEAFRSSAGTPGLNMNSYQQNMQGMSSNQYLPTMQAQLQAQAQAQAQGQNQGQGQGQSQRGGTTYSGVGPNLNLYQLQLQHAAMKNQNGMPLAQSSGPLARMQALTSAFGGIPPATSGQSQNSMPAYAQGYGNTNTSASGGGPIRFGQQMQHSAQSFNQNSMSSQSANYGMQATSGGPMQKPTSSSQGQNQSQGQVQLPPLDWSNLGKSTANMPYPTAAPYRSAHIQGQTALNTSLPSGTPAMSSAPSMSSSASAANNSDSAGANVGVGLNLPGGVEGLAIKQPWLSTAPSNAATAARLANLGIGIGPGVNPNVGGPDQPSERRKSAVGTNAASPPDAASSNPPIVNTGNSGPMCVQPGDWVCSSCGFVNWRRRRVCLRCFPFAEGNETAASLANGAILAAQLAAGVSPSKVDTASLLKSPSRSRESRTREQSASGSSGYEHQGGQQMGGGPIVGLGLNLGQQQGYVSPMHGMARYPSSSGAPAYGVTAAMTPSSSAQSGLLLNPFGSAPPTRRTSPNGSPALMNAVPNWAAINQAERIGLESLHISAQSGLAQEWQRRTSGGGPGAGRTVSGPIVPTTRAPGGPTTTNLHNSPSHIRQTSFNSAPSLPGSDILGSGSAPSSAWHASPGVSPGAPIFTPSTTRTNSANSTSMSIGAAHGSGAGKGTATSTRNIWGTSPPRNIGGNKLVDEDNKEVSASSGVGGAGRGSMGLGACPPADGGMAARRPRPIGCRDSAPSSMDTHGQAGGDSANNNNTSPN